MTGIRALLITTAYPSRAGDPRGAFIEVLARHLRRQGVQVTVLAPGAPDAPQRENTAGVQVVRARYWLDRSQRLARGVGGIVPNLRNEPWLAVQLPGLLASLTAAALRLASDVDLIHAHWVYPSGFAGLLAAHRHRLPLIVTSHGGDLNLARRVPPLRWVSRWISRRADMCVGVSHAMVSGFQELGVPSQRIRFLPLGVEMEEVGRAEPRDNVTSLRVMYVGSLIPRKSVETLLLAHAELQRRGRHLETVIVGSGPSETSLRELSARQELNGITFLGEQPHSGISSLMRNADVLVLPSLSEGRGMVILEAMALGLPVIASDIPGPREIVVHGCTGLLFEPGNAKALAEALERLVGDPDTRSEYGSRGRALLQAEGLTAERSASAHVELYREVLATARTGA